MRIKTAYPIPLNFIKDALSPRHLHSKSEGISYISTDTRELSAGDLYFALPGTRFDGEAFIARANDLGAISVGRSDSASICVHDTVSALSELARRYKGSFFEKPTVAITGSVGKTTTKNLTAALLSKSYKVHATKGNLNNEIGVPLTLLSAGADTEALVIEMGMNHRGEIRRLSLCAEPSLSVITSIGTAHIGNLGSMEAIAEAKAEILDGMTEKRVLVPHGEKLLRHLPNSKTVSSTDFTSDHFLKIISQTKATLTFKYRSQHMETKVITLPSPGMHFAPCLAFAISVCDSMGLSCRTIECALESLKVPCDRIIRLGRLSILNDCYNSSVESVHSALASLSYYTPRSALLGNMLELGDFSADLHREIGYRAAKSGLRYLYLIGESSGYIEEGALSGGMKREQILTNSDPLRPDISADQIISTANGETVLFKASRGMHLEAVINIIKDYFN